MTKVLKYFLRVMMLIVPVFFLPVIMDGYGFGKVVLMMAMGMVGLVLWLGYLIWEKKEVVKFNWGWILFLLMTVWMGYLFYRLAPGIQMRAVMGSNGLLAMAVLTVWGFLWLQVTDKEEAKEQLNWLTVSGAMVAIASIVSFLIPASKLPIVWPKDNPLISISANWSLTGSLLSEVVLMVFLVLEWGKRLLAKLKNNENYIVTAVATAALVLAMGLSVAKIIKTGWVVLDGTTSWIVAVESFKRSPLMGSGIGNFVEAFNLYRPASYNMTKYWTNGFNVSINGWMQLWTETGLVGLGLIILLILLVVKQQKSFDLLRLALLMLAFLFLPVNLMIWWLLMWTVVSTVLENRKVGLVLKVGESGINAAPWIAAVVLVAVMVWGGYNVGKVVAADYFYRQSLIAMSKNDGGSTYNLQIKAIGLNQLASEYRRTYSQTNLALAANLLANKNISEEDKQKASTLVQQAVREGKAAVSLDQQDVTNWSNLAQLYRQLIGVVDGSPDWSFQAYQQAMILDPTNPSLGLDLGGLLFAAGRYEEADRVFEQAVSNKPDFANAWYNWAHNAKNLNRLGDAVQRMTQAVALVPVTSGDYEKANGELTTWKKEYDAAVKKYNEDTKAAAKQAETLKTSEPLPTAGKEEKVNVPAGELQPPTPQATTVTPTVSP